MGLCVKMRIYAYDIVGNARWADLNTSHHHIKYEPLGEGLMLRSVCAKISPSRRTNDAACISRTNIYQTVSEL